jgi:hypothetical protein
VTVQRRQLGVGGCEPEDVRDGARGMCMCNGAGWAKVGEMA